MTNAAAPTAAEQRPNGEPAPDRRGGISPNDLYDQLDPVGQKVFLSGDSWHDTSSLAPGLYLTDPQGHALLVGVNGRSMTLIDFGPAVADIGSVQVRSPEVLEQLADRLRFMAARLRQAGGIQ